MARDASEVERFARAVQRRLVIVRAVERAGIGAMIGAAGASVFALALLAQGREAIGVVGAVIAIGALAGLLDAVVRRPTRLSAAMEADRQLKLADLLATAIQCDDADDPWKRAVRTMAEARCRAISPNDLVLHRLGARAWGGVGLAVALSLTLGALTALPERTGAQVSQLADHAVTIPSERSEDESAAQRVAANSHPDRSGSESGLVEQASDVGGREAGKTASAAQGMTQAGGTEARTSDAFAGERLPAPGATRGSETDGEGVAVASGAGGTGETAQGELVDGVAGASEGASAAPWEAPSWERQRAEAMQSISNGSVPARYRAVVREYFSQR